MPRRAPASAGPGARPQAARRARGPSVRAAGGAGRAVGSKGPLLSALLDEAAHEVLGVGLEDLVDLVQDGVDVVVQLVLALLEVRGLARLSLDLLDVLRGAVRPLLAAAGVLGRHVPHPARSRSPVPAACRRTDSNAVT